MEENDNSELSESGEEWRSDDEAQESEVKDEDQSEAEEEEEEEEEDWDGTEEGADVDVEEDDDEVDEADEQEDDEEDDQEEEQSAQAKEGKAGNVASVWTTPPTIVRVATRPVDAESELRPSNLPPEVVTPLRALSYFPRSASREWSTEQPAASVPHSSMAAVAEDDDGDKAEEYDEYDEYDELDAADGSSEYDMSDESDGSSVMSHQRMYWDRPTSCYSGGDEYARSTEDGTAALYALCESVSGLSYRVSDVAPALHNINANLARISRQQRAHDVSNTTGTSRCAEMGWPAASLSLLTVLLMLIAPLWLPWAWERYE